MTASANQRRSVSVKNEFAFSLGEMLAIVFVAAYLVAFFRVPLSADSLPGEGHSLRRLELLTLLTVPAALGDVLRQDPAPGWLQDRVYLLAIATGYLVVAATLGSVLLRWLRPSVAGSRIEQWVFALALGMSGLSLATLLLGVLGLLNRWLFLTIAVAIGIAFALARPRHDNAAARHVASSPAAEAGGLGPGWLWILAPLVVLLVSSAMLPPLDFDVREYHLQAPKEFFQNGQIGFLPHNIYANMPLGAEMHALASMVITRDWFTGALVGKTIIACFALITAAAVYSFGCRFFSRSAGGLAAIVYLSTPWVLLVSSQGLVDVVVGCYALLAIYALALWQRAIADGEAAIATRRLILCGLMAGSAAACKYPAMVFVALPIIGFVAISSVVPRDHRSRLYGAVVLMAAMAVTCGPWFVKNWVLAGNPTYPLLYSVFGGETRTPEKNAQWKQAHRPPDFAAGDFANRLQRAFVTSEWLGVAMAPLAALGVAAAFLRRRWAPRDGGPMLVLQVVGYCAIVFVLWWLLTHRIDRFLIPLMPMAALIAGSAMGTAGRPLRRELTAALLALSVLYSVAVGIFVFHMATVATLVASANGWFVQEDYGRQRASLVDLPPGLEIPNGKRLLLVGDAQAFDYRVPVLYNTCFDACVLEEMIAGKSADQAKAALHAAKVSHIYFDRHELARYRSRGNYGYSAYPNQERFDRLVAEGVLRKFDRDVFEVAK